MISNQQNRPDTNRSGNSQKVQRQDLLAWGGLALIILLAATLRFSNINSLGYVNHYYAAAVKSMLQSWHNFFFVAAEPGGSVSVDKPPLGLWLQAISAYFLGVNSLGLLLPQILAGLASVVLVHHLVRRWFGTGAGLLAALALAITPVVVATDRNNTIDSTMIFTLLLAAWAFIKATETSKMRFLLLGSALVGVAFNIKMLAAYLPLPAFFVLYLLGAHETLRCKIGKLVLAGLLLLVISFSWAVAVDLTPEDQRPYVGSSSDNTELTLIFGYNGVSRLLGMARNRFSPGAMANRNPGIQPSNPQPGTTGLPPSYPAPSAPGAQPQLNPNQGGIRQPPINQRPGNPNQPRNAGGGGAGFNIGRPGLTRLFIAPLSKEASWLLPVGLVSMVLLLAGSRLRWTLNRKHQALVLWGGWLMTGGVFFSIATFFHEYYLSLLGPPLAALAGIGLRELWEMRKNQPRLATLLILAISAGTLAFQFFTAHSFIASPGWLPWMIGASLIGAILLIVTGKNKQPLALAGFGLVILAMYITPFIWSVYTNLSAGSNLSLPAAYSGQTSHPIKQGDAQVNQKLLNFLEASTQDITYLMAVPSSMQGADYVLASGRPVLYVGGFNGTDEVVSAEDLAQMVQDGQLRYVYWGAQGIGSKGEITTWVTSTCTPVEGFNTSTRNFGAPDGTSPLPNAGARQANDLNITLYDCGA